MHVCAVNGTKNDLEHMYLNFCVTFKAVLLVACVLVFFYSGQKSNFEYIWGRWDRVFLKWSYFSNCGPEIPKEILSVYVCKHSSSRTLFQK